MRNFVKKTMVMLLCIAMTIGVVPPLPAGADILLAEKLPVEVVTAFERKNPIRGTMAGVFLTDLTEGGIIASKNSTMLTSSSELTEWLLLLYALRNTDLNKEVTITKTMLDTAKKASYPVMAGLQEKDTITLENLLKLFIMARADDVRVAMVSAIAGSEQKAVTMMNQLVDRLELKDTVVVASDGAYVSGQHTNAYDLYVVFRELLTHELFAENYQKASLTVRLTKEDGSTKTLRAKNSEQIGRAHV